MKRIIVFRSILYVIMASFVLSSCKESWLDPKPLSIYTPENVYTNEDGLKAILVPLRESLRRPFYGAPSHLTIEYMTSDYGVAGEQRSGMAQDFDNAVHPSGMEGFFNPWNFSWPRIRDANTIISRIESIEWASETNKNAVWAEAYFHRAYWYYLLVHQYGDVPFINVEHAAPKLDFYSHSRKTILNKIQADLEFAVQHLPITVAPGQISRGAGQHLLTKVLLANLEFEKAIQVSTSLIESSNYQLMTDRFGSVGSDVRFNVIWDLHQPENKSINSNVEEILTVQDKYGFASSQTGGTSTMRAYTPWWSHALWLKDPDGNRACVDMPGNAQILQFGRGVGIFRPANYLNYDIWKDSGTDLRHDTDTNWMPTSKVLINNPTSPYFGQPVDFKYSNPGDSIRALYPWPQYKVYIKDELRPLQPTGGNSDWYVFRLAETYLLRAEAYYWLGRLSESASDINRVRARSKAPLIESVNVSIDYILDERARELYLEEPRKTEITRIALILAEKRLNGYSIENFATKNYWFDRVIDHGKFYNQGIVWEGIEYQISPYHVFWPVPQNAIDANTKGRINQNVGYRGAELNIEPLQEITDNQ